MNNEKIKPDIKKIADVLQENPEMTAALQPITNDLAQAHFDAHAFTDVMTTRVLVIGGMDMTIGQALALHAKVEKLEAELIKEKAESAYWLDKLIQLQLKCEQLGQP